MEQVPIAKPKTIEVIRNKKIEENVKKINQSDIERNYEDILKQQKLREREVNDKQKKMVDNFRQKMLDRANATAKQA